MSAAETEWWEKGDWPMKKGDESRCSYYEDLRKRAWAVENPCAGNIDTTIAYGKWIGDDTHFTFVEFTKENWAGNWGELTDFHYGYPIVKYRWGSGEDEVDLFVLDAVIEGSILNKNPPVMGGKLNPYWKLYPDPNKYHHWDYNAGRPDIEADGRWIIVSHGQDEIAKDWYYGRWKAYYSYPRQRDSFEQIKPLKQGAHRYRRHRPVEQLRKYFSHLLSTFTTRTFKNGTVGTPPNESYWIHHFLDNKISEYIMSGGEPIESEQWDPTKVDKRDPKINQAYQDRVQHLIEQNFNYLIKVDEDWKKSWQYWHFYGMEMDTDHDAGCPTGVYDYSNPAGSWNIALSYNKAVSVYHNSYFWRAIAFVPAGESSEPGVGANWELYWVQGLYQPNYINTDPIYVRFSDPLWHCNSSAFEKVLKEIGHYDWYWDETYPPIPWIIYQKHYHLITLEKADPGKGYGALAWSRYPLPRGGWRRIWRYTQHWKEWDYAGLSGSGGKVERTNKSRFGKEINIDGKMVAMMWPGELGNPPGYDEQLQYVGVLDGVHYDSWTFKHIISQGVFDGMDRSGPEEWTYTQYYTVVSVEDLFKQAYKNNSKVEQLIAERHAPVATDWQEVYNEVTKQMEWKEFPIYEIHHDLVNDMRDALLQLKFLRNPKSKDVLLQVNYTHQQCFNSGIAAYQAGKEIELYDEYETSTHRVGYLGFVCYYTEEQYQYSPWDETLPEESCRKSKTKITLTSQEQDIPGKTVGSAMIRILYRTYYTGPGVIEGCDIGVKNVILHDGRSGEDLPWKSALVALAPKDFKWVWNASEEKWELRCSYLTDLLCEWPQESFFGGAYGDAEQRQWSRQLEINWAINEDCVFCIDFDGFEKNVFELDWTKVIEV